MAGVAQLDRIGLELIFERIAEAIDRQQRCALIEFAIAEQAWHATIDYTARESAGCNQRAA
ncbi:hypothetical protein [Mycolicibacterium lutetiense]